MLGLNQAFHRRGGTPFGGADVDYLIIVIGDREPKLSGWSRATCRAMSAMTGPYPASSPGVSVSSVSVFDSDVDKAFS